MSPPPPTPAADDAPARVCGGFWVRFWAQVVDALLVSLLAYPLGRLWYATPGKLLFSLRVVDAATGEPPRLRRSAGRYLGQWMAPGDGGGGAARYFTHTVLTLVNSRIPSGDSSRP